MSANSSSGSCATRSSMLTAASAVESRRQAEWRAGTEAVKMNAETHGEIFTAVLGYSEPDSQD